MKEILVATDFSDVADNAVHYACNLARDCNASVTLLHSFIIPVTFSDVPMPVMPVEEGRRIAEDRMNLLLTSVQASYSGLQVKSKIMFGDIIDCIEEHTEAGAPLFIILGNSGSGESSFWLGSNVLSGFKNLRQTVLTLSEEVKYRKPEKICFACDLEHISNHLDARALLDVVALTGAELHVLNVDSHSKKSSPDISFESTDLHHALVSVNPVYHYVEKDNVEEGIQEFIEANHMDWLVIVPHKHSFFEGLFHKSHTKAIMKMIHIPLVAIHEK
jgi:nucleotide-binding universal stress UspA family protein